MGFEVFLNAYEHTRAGSFELSLAREAFGAALVHEETQGERYFWRLVYSAQDRAEVYGGLCAHDARLTGGFMVAGPPGDLRFHAALLRILQASNTALYWPGENALVVGRAETVAHLDSDMVATLGAPLLARAPEEILERIRQS